MKKIASELLVERLIEWGVDTVFGLPGDGINGLMEGFRRHQEQIRFVLVHHEEAAAFMACGYAKSTGRLGVCVATSGPGGLHLLNGLYDAKLDHAPVLALTGMEGSKLVGTGFQQEVHLEKVFDDVADYNAMIHVPVQIPTLVDFAVRSALANRSVSHLTFPGTSRRLRPTPTPTTVGWARSHPATAPCSSRLPVPLLNHAPFLGGDDFLGSARERIFLFVNGQTGKDNPESQGLNHLILDGRATEDANLGNQALLDALRDDDGDALNIQGDFPSLKNPRFANAYSPLWDAQVGEWTPDAVAKKLNTRQTDENTILQLVVEGLITGPGGSTFGAGGFVINCPVLGFVEGAPEVPQTADPFAAKP